MYYCECCVCVIITYSTYNYNALRNWYYSNQNVIALLDRLKLR